MKYSEKLSDPRWQKKRLEIFERDGWACIKCGDSESTLHVHHVRYIPGKDPWDYKNHMLMTLCANCHEAEKEMRRDYESCLLDILRDFGFLADDIYSITAGFVGLHSQYPPEVSATIVEFALSNQEEWDKICKDYFNHITKSKKT